ncbi:MAG: ABC-type nitrate/sulfonate/bicarbonate transport system, periplasmic component, partial [Clostridiales bacterium]|nr:ABC-type nitrate/sulfonate/bicarbonate transport system, periplasmic component [Clostridiales bacterium]
MLKIKLASRILLAAVITFSIITSGCSVKSAGDRNKQSLSIAEQFGLAYAPLQIIKELDLLEKNLPETDIRWKQLGNTAAIREAMLADEADAGFMAIPPFLIGWDKGMTWKIACG